MKLHATAPTAANAITGYGDGYVLVNGQRHESGMIVTPDQVLPWDVSGFEKLTAMDFEKLKSLKAEIILLGTGPRQRFPHPSLSNPWPIPKVWRVCASDCWKAMPSAKPHRKPTLP